MKPVNLIAIQNLALSLQNQILNSYFNRIKKQEK